MKRYLTGIKSTGMPHLGNLLGAIKPAINFSNTKADAQFIYFIADYHSLTGLKNPALHREYAYEIAAAWLACGLDPNKAILYKQSDIPEIFELNWMLACHTPKGDLNRAHSYKAALAANLEKGEDEDHGVNTGLYTYPVLMAADILLFDTDFVPVGKDQVQHIEIARSIAQRMNQLYGNILKEPKELLDGDSAYIVGLDGRKMSKSYDNHIPIFLAEKKMQKMINRIVTDSTGPTEPKNPDTSFLFSLYSNFATAQEIEAMKKRYLSGIGWGEAKAELFQVINREVAPMREKYEHLMANKNIIDEHLTAGAEKARAIAKVTMARLREKVLGK